MSRGLGEIERRIGELFAATKDRALSVGEIAAYAFELTNGAIPNRKQRLWATRAAHPLLKRAAEALVAYETALAPVRKETTAKLGRPPGGRGYPMTHIFEVGGRLVRVDAAFRDAR